MYETARELAAAERREGIELSHGLQSRLVLEPDGTLRGRVVLSKRRPAARVLVLEGGGDELGVLHFADRVCEMVAQRLVGAGADTDWRTRLRTSDAVHAFAQLLVSAGLVRQAHGLERRPVLDRVAVEWLQPSSGFAAW
jgi:hypothetical protein